MSPVVKYLAVAVASALATTFIVRNHYLLIAERAETARLTAVSRAKDNERQMQETAAGALRAAEQMSSYNLYKAVAQLRSESNREIESRDALLAQWRNGTLRLRDPGPTAVSPTGAAAKACTAEPADDGAGGTELSGPATEFLLREASRANQVVLKLQSCHRQVTEDRQILEEYAAELERLNSQ